MRDAIKKVIFKRLISLPDNKALLWPDFQVAFDVATGESLNDHLEEVQSVFDELESQQYVRLEKLPNGRLRIIKGIDFDKWESSMNPRQEGNINIGNVNAQNVQVGKENIMHINITPEEFINALGKLAKNPEKSKSVIEKMNQYLKEGLGIGELVKKFVALLG